MMEALKIIADSWPIAWMFFVLCALLLFRRMVVWRERTEKAERQEKRADAARQIFPQKPPATIDQD